MIRRPAALLIAALLVLPVQALACSKPAGAQAAEAEVIRLVNAQRQQAGLPGLKASGKLAMAAQVQACDNAARRIYSHVGSDGSDLATRLKRTGYRYRLAAENTGRGFNQAARVVAFWMNSPEHRANILLPRAREIGVGLALSDAPESRNHWITVMGASR